MYFSNIFQKYRNLALVRMHCCKIHKCIQLHLVGPSAILFSHDVHSFFSIISDRNRQEIIIHDTQVQPNVCIGLNECIQYIFYYHQVTKIAHLKQLLFTSNVSNTFSWRQFLGDLNTLCLITYSIVLCYDVYLDVYMYYVSVVYFFVLLLLEQKPNACA